MKSFKSFKQWVFPNLFPAYYKDYDTYKDKNGKGILERFIEDMENMNLQEWQDVMREHFENVTHKTKTALA